MFHRLNDMSQQELLAWIAETAARRQQTLGKTPARQTVAALSAAWNVPKETLAKAVEELLQSKKEAQNG